MSVESQLAALSPDARIELIDVGEQFNRDVVLDQIEVSLEAFGRTGAELATAGVTAEDADDLRDIQAAIIAAGEDRTSVGTGKSVGRKGYQAAISRGKVACAAAITVLQNSAAALARKPDPTNPDAAATIASFLQKTGSVGRSGTKVIAQLGVLELAFADQAVAKATATRGGPAAKAEIEAAHSACTAARPAHLASGGTPVQTQHQNLLEGLAVSFLRAFRKAARTRAKQLGNPALAKAYELTKLYAGQSSPEPKPPIS